MVGAEFIGGVQILTKINRRNVSRLLASSLLLPLSNQHAEAQGTALTLMTAGQGSAFLPYGEGIVKVLGAAGIANLSVKESKGSIENLGAVDSSPLSLGTAFIGSAFEAVNGTGFAAGRKHANVRALFPMYETAFMVAALRSSNLSGLKALDGRLAKFKMPKRVIVVDELPRNAMGKVQKNILRDTYAKIYAKAK